MQALKTRSDFFNLVFNRFRGHQWFQVFLIFKQNSFIIIDVILFVMIAPRIAKNFHYLVM